MNIIDFSLLKIYPTQGINSVSWSHSLPGACGFFVAGRVSYLQGVLRSSSLPDCIEDKKSGGQKSDRHNTSLCNDSTIIIGREVRQKPDAKNRNIVTLIGTLN